MDMWAMLTGESWWGVRRCSLSGSSRSAVFTFLQDKTPRESLSHLLKNKTTVSL